MTTNIVCQIENSGPDPSRKDMRHALHHLVLLLVLLLVFLLHLVPSALRLDMITV